MQLLPSESSCFLDWLLLLSIIYYLHEIFFHPQDFICHVAQLIKLWFVFRWYWCLCILCILNIMLYFPCFIFTSLINLYGPIWAIQRLPFLTRVSWVIPLFNFALWEWFLSSEANNPNPFCRTLFKYSFCHYWFAGFESFLSEKCLLSCLF